MTSSQSRAISHEEVQKHTSSGDTWLIVDNTVIDVSLFMFQHPGGERILKLWAGKDATNVYRKAGHKSALAQRLLQQYTIGTLAPQEPPTTVVAPDMPPPPPPPQPQQPQRRKKVPLAPGFSAMDWMRKRKAICPQPYRKLSLAEVQSHNTVDDCWLVLRGQVYDVTPYLHFHPGGVNELLRGAGGDATTLFNEVHAWVNYTFLLEPCLIGSLAI